LIKKIRKYKIEIIAGIVIALASLFLLPHIKQYSLLFHHKIQHGKNLIIKYKDLNFDGKSEQINFFFNNGGFASFIIKDGERTHGQWIFKGEYANAGFYFFDYDNNGYKEVYVFTRQNDSLFLNAVESFSGKQIIKDKFIIKIDVTRGWGSIGCASTSTKIDIDGDGYKDFIFSTLSGYNYKSRGLFCYNIKKDTLIKSSLKNTSINYPLFTYFNDSVFYLTGYTGQTGNTPKNSFMSDQYAWIMVFDKNMNFVFPPVKVGKYPSTTYTKPIKINNEIFFFTFYNHSGIFDTSKIFITNKYGKIIKQRLVPEYVGKSIFMYPDKKNTIKILCSDGYIEIFNNKLQSVKKYYKKVSFNYGKYLNDDFTGDSISEFITYDIKANKYYFYDPASEYTEYLDFDNKFQQKVFSKYNDGKNNYIYCDRAGDSCYFLFKTNWLYKIRYLLPFAGIIGFLILYAGIKKIFNFYLNKRIARQNQIAKLQLLNVKNQLDSHFTFNIIDCIGNNFRKNDYETANKLFTHYSRLLQQSVQMSNEIAVPISKELEYIENYLALERARYNYKFNFEIANKIKNDIKIPKYLLFTFVENAVKHGIAPINEREGIIEVEAMQNNKQTTVIIKDNGIGLGNGKTKGTGNGLKIISKLIELFKLEYKINIKYDFEEEYSKGTLVKLYINHE